MSTIDPPPRIAQLPRNKVGYPIPWFVDRAADRPDGEPDFRLTSAAKIADAVRFKTCWVCGQTLGRHVAFVVGPMCAVNRVSADPPMHVECAEYSAKVCPFLSTPRMHRRPIVEHDTAAPAGIMIDRNPGVALVHVPVPGTSRPFRASHGGSGILFDIGQAARRSWWAAGRPALPEEIDESLRTGYPLLLEEAKKDGADAIRELDALYQAVRLAVLGADKAVVR